MAIKTKGGRRRAARRKKRQEAKAGSKQYYGGDEKALKDQRSRARIAVEDSGEDYRESTKRLNEVGDRADDLEGQASSDYNVAKSMSRTSRSELGGAIDDIGTAGKDAIAMRNSALAANDLRESANAGILANDAVAADRLRMQQGLIQRSARGLAGSMGEGGALAMQQAIASAGTNAADLALQNANTQAQMANDMRLAAAQGQVQNALGVADANAGTTMATAGDIAAQRAALLAADRGAQDAATARQVNLLGVRGNLAQAGTGAALDNQGQFLSNEQTINTAQLGIDVDHEARMAALRGGGFKKAVSTLLDPADMRGSGEKGII